MKMKINQRVKYPKYWKEDNTEFYLGTITEIFPDGRLRIVWDHLPKNFFVTLPTENITLYEEPGRSDNADS